MNYTNMDSYIISELNLIINDLNKFPTQSNLISLNKGSLLHKINKNGGLNKFRLLMDYTPPVVPNFYFKDINNILDVIYKCKLHLGYTTKLPTIIELEKFRPGIKYAINKYHGGYRHIRDILNEPQLSKSKGYWKDFNNVSNAIETLEKQTLTFPTVSDINNYGPPGLYAGINLYHGGIVELQKKMNRPIFNKSKFEQKVKLLLDQHVDCIDYVDNYRSKLKKFFNITLVNPKNERPLELDRYYYTYKVAIEIQGEQHEKEVNYFAKQKNLTPSQYLLDIKELDLSKKQQCENQGIVILYIYPYMKNDDIINLVSKYLPIRSNPLTFESTELSIEERLLALEEKKGSAITSDDIKNESQSLYKDVLAKYNSLCNARKSIGLSHIKEAPNSWTLDKVLLELKPIINKLGRMPKKSELSLSLYYGVQKYGGLKKLAELISEKE